MRFKQIIENTTAGSVATVAKPMMTQTRENTNVRGLKPVQQVMKGAKKKGPYANSIVESKVTEDDLAEQDLIVIPGQGRLKRTGFVKHDLDQGEHEGHTLKNSLHTIARAASDLDKRLSVQSEFPEWVSEKIGAAKGMMVSVMDYLISSQEMQHDPDAMNESSERVDSIVTDALKRMKGPEVSDAVLALKRVLGDRAYNERRGFYSFYVDQIHKMYNQQSMAEAIVSPQRPAAGAATAAPGAVKPALPKQLAPRPAAPAAAPAPATTVDPIQQKSDQMQQGILDRIGKRFGLPPGSSQEKVKAAQQAYLDKNDPAAAAQYKQNMNNIAAGGSNADNKPVQLAPKAAAPAAPSTDNAGALSAGKANKSPIAIMLAQPTIANNQQMLDVIAPTLGLPTGSTIEQILAADDARNAKAGNKYAASTATAPVAESLNRAVDAKGRTAQEWVKLVKAKYPDAKIMQSKMPNGPWAAKLSDGRTTYWEPAEQDVAEGEKDTSRMNQQHQDFYNKNPNFKRDDREVKSIGGRLATKVTPKTAQVTKKPMTPFEGKIDFAKKLQGKVDKHNKAVVKTKQDIGSRVADIGAGGKEHNEKTDAAWDAAKKKVSEGLNK